MKPLVDVSVQDRDDVFHTGLASPKARNNLRLARTTVGDVGVQKGARIFYRRAMRRPKS